MTAILGSVRGGAVTSAATSRCIATAAASAAACTPFSRVAAGRGARADSDQGHLYSSSTQVYLSHETDKTLLL